jgi:hypothetical protein
MPNKLTQETFRFAPSEELQFEHRAAIRNSARALLLSRIESASRARQKDEIIFAELRRLIVKSAQSDTARPVQAGFRQPDPAAWLRQLEVPNPPRLKKPIFRLGSLHAVSIPESQFPWGGWIDPAPPAGGASHNNASADGSLCNNNDTLNLWAWAGFGIDAPNGGGNASAFGYQGQYFTAAVLPDSGVPIIPAETWLTISASPSISYGVNWGTDWLAYAAVTLSAQIIVQVFPPQGNSFTLYGPSTTIYARDQNTGGDEFNQPPATFQIDYSFTVSSGYSYGVFVQYMAYAQASFGIPTGALSAGSYSWCGLTSVLPAIQYDAVCTPSPL